MKGVGGIILTSNGGESSKKTWSWPGANKKVIDKENESKQNVGRKAYHAYLKYMLNFRSIDRRPHKLFNNLNLYGHEDQHFGPIVNTLVSNWVSVKRFLIVGVSGRADKFHDHWASSTPECHFRKGGYHHILNIIA
jgi:hypothetical protein